MNENLLQKAIGIMLVVIVGIPPDTAEAQSACSDSLIVARDVYSRGQFDRSIYALRGCWQEGDGLNTAEHREVLRILAISYLYMDNTNRVHRMMRHLMRNVDQKYRSDPLRDPIVIQDLANKYRIKWYEKRWVQLSTAAVAGGVAAYLILD